MKCFCGAHPLAGAWRKRRKNDLVAAYAAQSGPGEEIAGSSPLPGRNELNNDKERLRGAGTFGNPCANAERPVTKMKQDEQQTAKYARKHQRKKRWYRVVTCLAAVVVFCTTYALILPAITLERTTCEIPEHTHTGACYTQTTVTKKVLDCDLNTLGVHQHTSQCYDGDGALVCGYADFVVHQHDSACYDEDGNLCCTLPEMEPHEHTDSCYAQQGAAAQQAHAHTEDCYTLERGELICGQQESEGHTHTADCYREEETLICGQEENPGHQHEESCYDQDGVLICEQEENPGHQHTGECYEKNSVLICGREETAGHQHTDECYRWNNVLTCTLSTEPADQEAAKPELVCGKQEIVPHQHTADCYDETGGLICGKLEVLEHQHTDACFKTVEETVEMLTCDQEEHIHGEECRTSPEESMAVALLSDEEEAGQSDTARADLTSYIGSDTNFTAAKYNPTTDQVEVSFHMTFGMTKSDIQNANYQFTYTLPNGLIIPDDMLGKTYEGRDTSGAKGFTYQFVKNDDETYSILVDFDQTYVDSHDNFSGYIDFSAYAGEDAWKEGGGYEFKFNDNCTVTIPVSKIEQEEDESIHYNIAVSKSNSGYDAATNKITYTVTVDTTKGTPDPLNLTDILTAQGLEVDKVEIGSVTRINDRDQWGNPIYNNGVADQTTLTKGNSATGDQYTFSYDSTNGIQMNLPGLKKGTSGNGQKYTITYDVYLKEPAAGASYTVGNKATVTGTDNSKGETVTDSAEASTTIDKSLTLQKYGTYDKAADKIKWTITVNQNGNNIAGATLKDSMFTGQTVTVSPDSGYTLNGDTITFSSGDGDTNTQTYTITYEKDAPGVGEDGTVTVENTATVTPPGGGTSVEVKAPVTIDKNMKMVKTGTYDKATDTITWTITVNENGNDIAGAELTDTMFSSVQADSIKVSPSQDGMTITQNSDGTIQKITFSAPEGGTTNTQTYTITYTTPSGIDANASGTVTNTATFDSKPGEEGGEITSGPGVWVDRTVDLDKSGGWYDSSTNRIYWKIDVNTKGNNIKGYTLTDHMLAQAVDETLTIKIGYNPVDINSTDNGFTINKDADGKITSITFAAIGETGANTNHYTIEYYTEAKPGWNSTTVTNTATLTPPDGTPITDEQTSSIPADGSVYKKCQGATALVPGGDSNITITWRTEINVPADGLPADTVVTDTLADGQWMDWRQIQKWGSILFAKQTAGAGEDYVQDINYWWPLGETYTILFYATDGTTCTYDDIVSNSNGAQNKKFTKYEITFPNGVPADIYGGETIYFEYDSYADVSGVTDEATYKNTVSVTPPDSTPKSSDATYTYKAPGVVKMDGDGKTGTSSIVTTNGELTWKVRVRLSADCTTLTLTDNLPKGVTLTGLTFANQELTIGEGGSITGTLEGLTLSNGSVTTGDDGKQTLNLTVRVPKGGTTPDYLKANGEFYVVYTCKISDALLEEAQNAEGHKVGTFTNSVTVTADSNEFPPAEQTQEVTYTKPTSGLDLVNKSGVWVNDSRLLEYSMLLNPDGMDLLPNSDTLTLTDELSYYVGNASEKFDVSLLPGSVVLYRAVQNEDGTWSRGEPVTDWSWSVATRTEYDGTQFYSTITATIPDVTPLILEYAYTVWVPEGSSFGDGNSTYYGMYNKATLSGISGGSDETKFDVKWKDSETSAGITADRAYIFYKVEENSYGNRLPGAEFTLYNSTGNALFTYTTDSNGSFVVQWQSEGNGGYQSFVHNTLYYVQETKAPEGYQLPDEPTKYYFYFSDATDTEHTLDTNMIPENAVDLSVTAYTAYVENTKNTTQITVNKKWFKSDGTTEITSTKAGSISFDLYQISSTTPPSGSGTETGGGSGESGSGTAELKFSVQGTITDDNKLLSVDYSKSAGTTVTLVIEDCYGDKSAPTVKLNDSALTTTVTDGTVWYPDWAPTTPYTPHVYTYTFNLVAGSNSVSISNISWNAGDWKLNSLEFSAPTPPTDPDTGDEPTEPTGTLYGTYTITKDSGWTWIKDYLPLTGKDEAGNTVYYTYYVVENSGTNYSTSYENNGGIVSGTITIKNTESDTPVYTLPETGGGGTTPYTVGGLALMAGAGLLLLYNHSKRRKEDLESS